MTKKVQKTSEITEAETFKIGSNKVLISHIDDQEILLLNGRELGFYLTQGGYLLKRDVYQKPVKTLRKAVERYLKRDVIS